MKKWKIGILLAVNTALSYGIFLICIHQYNSKYGQAPDAQESRVLALRSKYLPTTTTVTVEEIKKNRKAEGSRFELLDSADKAFLLEVAGQR